MPQLQLLLIPSPGAKPEFLATLDPSPPNFPEKVVLEGYTRDDWAIHPEKGLFQSTLCKSDDKKQKLGGFLSYLKERKKAAYGRFGSDGMMVIGSVQPPSKPGSTSILCRYTLTLSQVPNCPFAKKKHAATAPSKPGAPAKQPKAPGGGSGLLGNLLGAQRRTNQHVMNSVQQPKQQQKPATTTAAAQAENTEATTTTATSESKTSQQVLADFRQEMEQKMLDFDIASDTVLKIPISLSKHTAGLLEGDDKNKVTMEILKYIVYEQADEINEEWVAAKEPSEFMDEAVIAIYKEGHAPPEVLEDLNKGDLPDEIRGQQRAVQDAIRKQEEMKQSKIDAENLKQAHQGAHDDEDLATLNTVKRDRRTIEEIQREMNQENDGSKRQKTE